MDREQVEAAAAGADPGMERRPAEACEGGARVVHPDRAEALGEVGDLVEVAQGHPGEEPDPDPARVGMGERGPPAAGQPAGQVVERLRIPDLLHGQDGGGEPGDHDRQRVQLGVVVRPVGRRSGGLAGQEEVLQVPGADPDHGALLTARMRPPIVLPDAGARHTVSRRSSAPADPRRTPHQECAAR